MSEKHLASPLGGGREWSRCWRQTPNWELPLPPLPDQSELERAAGEEASDAVQGFVKRK